jgi:hypothetical protein
MSAAINTFVGNYTSAGKHAANFKISISLDARLFPIASPSPSHHELHSCYLFCE